MSVITTKELGLLRSRPHSTTLWLSIYKPSTVLSCMVNDAGIGVGAYKITYDTVTAGSYTNIKSGMTMLVGTAAGASDVGRIRVRSATNTVITVAENDDIVWKDNLYLTVISFFEVWPIFPYFVQDGDVVYQYKDYDIPYTNQNGAGLGAMICMGCHYAGFKDDAVYYSATGTVDVRGVGVSSYNWTFEGGSTGTSTLETPGYVTYSTPGHYTTTLSVTTSGSATDVSYRHISIYDRPGEGTYLPIMKWEMDTLSGSRDEGGYTVGLKVYENIDDVVDGALVVIFADDVYGDNNTDSIGGNSDHRQSIVFTGYVLENSIQYNYRDSVVSFEVGSVTQRMKDMEGPIISVDSAANPSNWYEIEDLNILKLLYHYYKEHSTLLLTTDLRYIGTNYPLKNQDTNASSLYDAINSVIESTLFGKLVADRQGNIWAETGVEAIENATGTIQVGMPITRRDWINEPEFDYVTNPPLSYLEAGGVAWSGISTGTWEAYYASAPGDTHNYFGNVEEHQGLALQSQAELNQMVGNVFAYENAQYPVLAFDIAGNYRNFDIAPQEQQLVTISADDTYKGIELTNHPFHITDIDIEYDPRRKLLLPTITMHEITNGHDGVTITIPQTPEESYPDQPPYEDIPWPVYPSPGQPSAPPWVAPPWEELPGCCEDTGYEANGPYRFWLECQLRSDSVDPRQREVGFWMPFASYIRTSAHTNKTKGLINAKWEISTDGGGTWDVWPNNDGWNMYASEGGGGQDVANDMSIFGGQREEERGGYFNPTNCYPYPVGGVHSPTSIDTVLDYTGFPDCDPCDPHSPANGPYLLGWTNQDSNMKFISDDPITVWIDGLDFYIKSGGDYPTVFTVKWNIQQRTTWNANIWHICDDPCYYPPPSGPCYEVTDYCDGCRKYVITLYNVSGTTYGINPNNPPNCPSVGYDGYGACEGIVSGTVGGDCTWQSHINRVKVDFYRGGDSVCQTRFRLWELYVSNVCGPPGNHVKRMTISNGVLENLC